MKLIYQGKEETVVKEGGLTWHFEKRTPPPVVEEEEDEAQVRIVGQGYECPVCEEAWVVDHIPEQHTLWLATDHAEDDLYFSAEQVDAWQCEQGNWHTGRAPDHLVDIWECEPCGTYWADDNAARNCCA